MFATLAFGAVYPWGYWPAALGSLASGVAGIFVTRKTRPRSVSSLLIGALVFVAIAIVLQVIPISRDALARFSPAAIDVIQTREFFAVPGFLEQHPISISPDATLRALGLFASFATMFIGVTRVFSRVGVRQLAEQLTVFAVLLALIGIIQKPLYSGEIYGFWRPLQSGNPFGPFVNRNHFAGWMLMALPVALGLLCASLDQDLRPAKPGWRNRILWLSTPESNRLVLIASGVLVMALALVLTMSRSGIAALGLALLVTGWSSVRKLQDRPRRMAAALYLGLMSAIVVAWIGLGAIVVRFAEGGATLLDNRSAVWRDAWSIAADFPLVGAGVNTYSVASLMYQRHDLVYSYSAAHNDYLQLAAEGGLLVCVPVLFLVSLLGRDIRHRIKEDVPSTAMWLRLGAVTSLVGIACQEAVDFSLQIPANAILFSLVCAIATHRPPVRRSQPNE